MRATEQTGDVAIRIFLLDERSGEQVAGTAVSVLADREGGKTNQVLAVQMTDRAGYVSFRIPRAALAAASRIRVVPTGAPDDALALSLDELLASDRAYSIKVNAGAATATHVGLPSLLEPDAIDLALSPGSIGHLPHLLPGSGLCAQLMPTGTTVRRFGAFRIVADLCKTEELECAERVVIARGKMLEYEIAWHGAGTALGTLLNTFSLAPCERVTFAIADWTRSEAGTSSSSSSAQQQAAQLLSHERLISEAMQGTTQHKTFATGASFQSGGAGTIPSAALNLTAAFGSAFSLSSTSQAVAASTTSRLSDRVSQEASFVASQRSNVVFQTTASEESRYQTRIVRNHNQCHTLNLMFYQVDQKYRVVTTYKGARDLVLVKYDNVDFDALRAWQHAAVLQGALLDADLATGFAELGKALFCCDAPARPAEPWMESLTFTFKGVQGSSASVSSLTVQLVTTSGTVPLPPVNPAGWIPGNDTSVTIPLPQPIDPRTVTGVLFHSFHSGGPGMNHPILILSGGIAITYRARDYDKDLALGVRTEPTWLSGMTSVPAHAELPPLDDGKNPCLEASCPGKKLLAHLNAHKRHYNSQIWMAEDPNDRVVRWSCCKEGSLLGMIENTPIGVHGDFVAFPAADSPLVDDPAVLPVTRLVTMPTPGVYSEGILGQCDTCEIQDPARYTDWKDTCCDDMAVPAPPAPSGSSTSLAGLKADALSALTSVLSLPSEPSSTLSSIIVALIGKADGGSEQAKVLLEKLIKAVTDSIPDKPESGK